jgi:hypothetical protein
MPDTSEKYRNQFLKRQLSYERKYKEIFNQIADEFARFAYDPNIKFTKAFVFPAYLNERMDKLIADFHDQVLELTETEIAEAWSLSNLKNDKLVTSYLSTISTIKATQKAAYFVPNIPALKSFLSTPHGTDTLSESVWKIASQFRKEMEVHLGIGVVNGDSADVISRRIRKYLKNPDALFRRVRDNQGRLVASKAMIENAPGRGVYNSAFKNAMRVARTNTNQAFLLADHLRWQELDMVKGVKISLSAQHPDYNFPEICEECEGVYPKDFIWVGWHPQCLCHATPVMSSQQDFLEYLRTGVKEVNNNVTQYPKSFENFVNDNFERYSNYSSIPFWMQDNAGIIKDLLK